MQSKTRKSVCPIHGLPTKRATCPFCNAAYMRAYLRRRRLETPTYALWERARSRARKRGLAFSISRSSIEIPSRCPVLGIPIQVRTKRSYHSPSLDRIIPERGYIGGNVRVISDRANRLKSNRTLAQLKERAQFGPPELRTDYEKVAHYVDREALLSEVREKAAQGGRAGEEWAKIARFLERAFNRQSRSRPLVEDAANSSARKDGGI